ARGRGAARVRATLREVRARLAATLVCAATTAMVACAGDTGDASGADAGVDGDQEATPGCETACAAQGKLCHGASGGDPWRDGAPVWSTCPDEPRATKETLAQKADAYDVRAMALHVHPKMPWVLDVTLAAGKDPETATAADVVAWRSGEND